jgi:transposase-like protein
MDDLFADRARFCCLNPRCMLFGFRNGRNLSVCGHIDKAKTIRQIYCNFCKKRFSERKGTVFYHSRLPRQKVIAILQHVQEGNGMRRTGRLVGTKEDTVIRYVRKAGSHAQSLHRHRVAFSPSDPGGAVR